MVIIVDFNWVNLLNDAIITYNNNNLSTENMTSVDASYNPEKVKIYLLSVNLNPRANLAMPKSHLVITLGKLINVTFSPKRYISNWNGELIKVN